MRDNNPTADPRAVRYVLLLILAAAFGLRFWGVWFGLPYLFHNDEDFEVIRALQLGAGEFDVRRISKGGYFYLLFLEYGILFAVLFVTGVVSSANEFAQYYISDPSAFYLIGRTTTAIIGAATAYVVYKIGRHAYSTAAGLVGAAFLAFNVLHADLSHYVTVDVPMTFLAMLSLYFALRLVSSGETKHYCLAALFAALATTTKMPAGLLVVSLLLAHYYCAAGSGRGVQRFLVDKRLWQAVGVFVVVYAITTPGILLYADERFWGILAKFGIGIKASPEEVLGQVDERALIVSTNLFVYYIDVLVDSMTIPVFLVCAGGLVYALWQRTPADVILASFVIITYLLISSSIDILQFFPRYALPIIPVLALFGGRLLVAAAAALGERRALGAAALVAAALVVWPVSRIVAADFLMTQEDTRAIAKEWVDTHIPAGSKILIEGNRTTLSNITVPLQNSAENLQESINYYTDVAPAPGRAKYFRMALKVLSGTTYDLVGVKADELQPLQHYKDLGIQYFVLRPEGYLESRVNFRWLDLVAEIRADPDVELIKRFEPARGHRPGPLIEIYRIDSNAEAGVPSD